MLNLIRWPLVCLRVAASGMQKLGRFLGAPNKPMVWTDAPLTEEQRLDVLQRVSFYAPSLAEEIEFKTELEVSDVFSMRPMLLHRCTQNTLGYLKRVRFNTFDVDSGINPSEGWEWCRLSFSQARIKLSPDSRARFLGCLQRLQELQLTKCYVFGTGPSLERASAMDWSDGYRIVCNTIVRDADLWNHIRPHFVVAADAIYHFGFTAFARQFRTDLKARLRETETFFLYPETFHGIVLAEFEEFSDRLLPVPQGQHRWIHTPLSNRFLLPNLGNVLNIALLPLACTLSKQVFLWGFDGRAPSDKLFWANSSKHSYPELMDSLIAAHPAFFQHHVPPDRPAKYVAAVHGDQLDKCLIKAEYAGWSFVMMHKSWTPTLQRRFHG